MSFAHPEWLATAVVVWAAMILVWRYYDARQRAALERFVAPQLRERLTVSLSLGRLRLKRAFFAVAMILLCVALAGPRAGFRWEQIKRRGNDIVFAVDTSRSMDTPDVKPTRLTRAKLAMGDFVDHLQGDAVGLVAFAGTAFLQTPLTLDYTAFHDSLNALDTRIIPRGGTDIASAIRATQAALRDRAGGDKILILVTDGEDLEGDALAAAKTAARQDGLKIFTVGVGTANGDLIPVAADQGGGFLRDSSGQLVKSHLDESGLRAIAAATGGAYAPLGATDEGLETIYREALAPLAKHDLQAREQKVYIERFQWPLAAALALLLCSVMMRTRRVHASRPARRLESPLPHVSTAAVAGLVAAIGLLPPHTAQASPSAAVAAYNRGNFAAAEQEFSKASQAHPKQPLWQFDAGDAAYKAGDYPQAAQAFEASLNAVKSASAKRLAEQQDAYYNLGNTLYREGQQVQQSDQPSTIARWTGALKAYDAALQLRADDADTKFNRDLVQRKLEELKKQPAAQHPPQPDKSKPDSSKQNQSQAGQSKQAQPPQGSGKQAQSQPAPGQQGQSKQASAAKPQPGNTPQNGQASDQPSLAPHGQQQAGQQAGQQPASSPALAQAQQVNEHGQSPAGSAAGSAHSGAAAGQAAQSLDDQRQPGEMSPAEARQLLDSVKNDQHRLPAASLANAAPADDRSDEPLKDW